MKTTNMTKELLIAMSADLLKTLPLAHYMKNTTIEVVLDERAPTSYFNPKQFNIHVAMSNIAEALAETAKTTNGILTDEDFEETVRTLLYHEVSHAMLTPKNLMGFAQTAQHIQADMANIIEDERIETILAKYYLGVDFKGLANRLIHYQHPKSFEEWVFYGLRLRKAPFGLAEMLNEFKKFMLHTCGNNSQNDDGSSLAYEMKALLVALRQIYDRYASQTQSQQQGQGSGKGGNGEAKEAAEQNGNGQQGQGSDNGRSAKGESQENGQSAEDGKAEKGEEKDGKAEGGKQKTAKGKKAEEKDGEAEKGEDGDAIKKAEEALEAFAQEELTSKIVAACIGGMKSNAVRRGGLRRTLDIVCADAPNHEAKLGMLKAIIRNQGLGHATAPTIASLNGKLNIKRYIKDQHLTMKWFDKSLGEGDKEAKKYQKKVLNIWLDQSGSFSGHCRSVNRIFKALNEIERERDDFEWHLVRWNDHIVLVKNNDERYSETSGGTNIYPNQINSIYKEINTKGHEVNIVLFDGEIGYTAEELKRRGYSEDSIKGIGYCLDDLKIFDNKRTIFITEGSNAEGIKKVCKNCRDVIVENSNYEGKLTENIISAFDMLV